MPSRKKKSREQKTDWLAVWDTLGLESLHNVSEWQDKFTEWQKQKVWNELKGQKSEPPPPPEIPLKMMLMRARFNSQRFYEIYTFSTTGRIGEADLRDWFQTSPQDAADWVRKNGNKIFGEGMGEQKAVIK